MYALGCLLYSFGTLGRGDFPQLGGASNKAHCCLARPLSPTAPPQQRSHPPPLAFIIPNVRMPICTASLLHHTAVAKTKSRAVLNQHDDEANPQPNPPVLQSTSACPSLGRLSPTFYSLASFRQQFEMVKLNLSRVSIQSRVGVSLSICLPVPRA